MKRIKLNHIFSMKIPLFLLFLIIGFLPVFIQSKFMNQSFSQTQIDGRMIEVQNQCLITGDRLTRAGYLLKENHDPRIDNWIPSQTFSMDESWWSIRISGS